MVMTLDNNRDCFETSKRGLVHDVIPIVLQNDYIKRMATAAAMTMARSGREVINYNY